jgi:PucR family transcriptional regulator, purine catabolism regulatory protein
VADCLAVPPLTAAVIVGGHAGLGRRARWVHVIDHEDFEESLTGSELILSSGVALKLKPELQRSIFGILERRTSAGLVLALGPYVQDVPEAMRRDADRSGIPLLTIPWEINFRDITQALLTRLTTEQYRLLEEVERVNKSLLGVVIERGDLDRLCSRLADVTGQRVAVLDAQMRLMGGCQATRRDPAIVRHCPELPTGLSRVTLVRASDGRAALAAPVIITGRLNGFVLMSTDHDEAQRSEAMLVEAATMTAALLIAQRDEIDRTERAHERDALLALIEGRHDPATVSNLGLLPGSASSILVVEVAGGSAEIDQRLIRRAIEPFSPRARVFEHAGQQIVVAPHVRRPVGVALVSALTEAMAAAGLPFRAGISEPFERSAQARQAYAEAREALVVGRWLDPSRSCFLSRDTVALAQFVRQLEAGPPARFVRVRRLAEHDAAHRGELLLTLECFLNANQNAMVAARKLSIHRHTLAYRLGRIGDILGCALTPDICFDLRLELIAHKAGGSDRG